MLSVGPLLSPYIPASLPSSLPPSLPPGSASPSPTRWPSLRVKAVFSAPLVRQKRCCSRASPHRPRAEQTQEKARTHTGIFLLFDRVV
ncbi:hypothetical protein NQZ68_040559 [Dissostichus eleginoides]|nr:hypothetical protein NQZ68_040559 [Dissostichus eleginoides]